MQISCLVDMFIGIRPDLENRVYGYTLDKKLSTAPYVRICRKGLYGTRNAS